MPQPINSIETQAIVQHLAVLSPDAVELLVDLLRPNALQDLSAVPVDGTKEYARVELAKELYHKLSKAHKATVTVTGGKG